MKQHSVLPSKKFIVSLISLLVIIVGIVIISTLISRNNESDEFEIVAEPMTFDELLSLDSNGNGIPNWEESLWGFNPFVLDTNGDGVSDAGYIAQLRARDSERGENAVSSENLTQSDLLARQIYGTLAILNTEQDLPDQTRDQIINAIQTQIAQPFVTPLDLPELSIQQMNTQERNEYIATINDIAEQYVMYIENDFAAFSQSLSTFDDLQSYEYLYEGINDIYEDLVTMNIPVGAQNIHQNFALNFANLGQALSASIYYEEDPAGALQAYLQLETLLEKIVFNIEAFNTYIIQFN